MPEPSLDWSSAEVKESKLTVKVEGELPEGWADTFNTTVKLLGGGSWGEIKLEEQTAEVSGATPGSEEKLKHFLDSVVQQANATHDTGEEDEDEQGEEDEGGNSDEESGPDKEMSERFRSFAKGDEPDSEEDDDAKDGDSE